MEKKEWEFFRNITVAKTFFQSYLMHGEIENAREILEKGYEPIELTGGLFYILNFRKKENFIPSLELLLEYGYPFSDLEAETKKRIFHANDLDAYQWVWLLQRGFDANWEIRNQPLLFRTISERIRDEEKSEIIFWLLASGAKVKNEHGEMVFELLKKRKLYFLIPVFDIFVDTFDEESVKEYKSFRLQSLFGRGK